MVLRRVFGPKRQEVAGDWRKLYSEELHDCTFHQILFIIRLSERTLFHGVTYNVV
jgi:hypothetical protein